MLKRLVATVATAVLLFTVPARATPLNIGYSDWPGFLIWQIGIEKGWFKESGVDVNFEWFDYSASMDAFAAGKLDADNVTNGDALVMGGNGTKNVMILPIDYSNGNDMVIGRPGIRSIAELKGKKVGVEVGLVDHLLLNAALKKANLTERDVTLVNVKTNDTPQVLATGDVAAIGVWQPSAGQALRNVPGSRALYTSADVPGLIYDGLVVSPQSLQSRKGDWEKVIRVWYRCVEFARDPKTEAEALTIMSARVGLTREKLKPLWKGTHVLPLNEAKVVMTKGPGLTSLYGSSENADAFNVANAIYKEHQKIDDYIDPALVLGMQP